VLKKRVKLTILITTSLLTVFTLIGSVQADPITPNVSRIYGQDRFQTSVAVAQKAFTGQKIQNVIIASGYNYPDALAASTLASKLKAPIILVGQSVPESQASLDYVKNNLVVSGTVTIVGGLAVVPKQIEQWLLDSGYNVVRLGGKDRFDTDALIINKLNVATGTPVFIASGNDFRCIRYCLNCG
jgi:putative cell wall-binding protein